MLLQDTVTCKFCSTLWREHPYSVQVKPKPCVGRSITKMLNKPQNKLRKFEQKFISRFTNANNKLVVTCSICRKKSKWPLPRKIPPLCLIEVKDPDPVPVKRKKKSKKDKMCGLKLPDSSYQGSKSESVQIKTTPLANINSIIVKNTLQKSSESKITMEKPNLKHAHAQTKKHNPTMMKNNSANLSNNVKSKKLKNLNKSILKDILAKSNSKGTGLKDFLNSL